MCACVQQEFNSTKLILLVCICAYSVAEEEKTTGVQFNKTDIISVHMLLTAYSVAETDDVW